VAKSNTPDFDGEDDSEQAREDAFLALLDSSEGLLQKIAWMFSRSEEDRKELIQEVIYRAWKALPGFRNESDPQTWLYSLARQTAANLSRDAKKKRMVVLPEIAEQGQPPAGKIDELAVIASLRDSEKEIVLPLLEGYKYSEISKMLGVALPNLRNRISRLRKRLEI
jgi:RNA polymerase sigma-70 factor (ECF subfamily)